MKDAIARPGDRPLGRRRWSVVLVALIGVLAVVAVGLLEVRPPTRTDEVELTGSGTSTDGRLSLVVTPSTTTVPAGGGPLTYTYAVTNSSATRLFFASGSDTKCPVVAYRSGMVQTSNYSYLEPGATATFTCSTTVTQNTTGTATFSFYEDGGVTSTVQATDTVTVAVDPAKGSCTGQMWFGSIRYASGTTSTLGKLGTIVPGGAATTTYMFPGSTTVGTGTSGMAIDPTAPRFLYSVNRYT